MIKYLPAMWETQVRSLVWEDHLEKGMVNPLQYSCLENSMDGVAWQATCSPYGRKDTRRGN